MNNDSRLKRHILVHGKLKANMQSDSLGLCSSSHFSAAVTRQVISEWMMCRLFMCTYIFCSNALLIECKLHSFDTNHYSRCGHTRSSHITVGLCGISLQNPIGEASSAMWGTHS